VDKAFTLRLVRCLLIGIGAFIGLLALDIKIRSPLDVAGYVLGIGALWYVFEIIVMKPPQKPEKRTSAEQPASSERKNVPGNHKLGEDHFD